MTVNVPVDQLFSAVVQSWCYLHHTAMRARTGTPARPLHLMYSQVLTSVLLFCRAPVVSSAKSIHEKLLTDLRRYWWCAWSHFNYSDRLISGCIIYELTSPIFCCSSKEKLHTELIVHKERTSRNTKVLHWIHNHSFYILFLMEFPDFSRILKAFPDTFG